MHSSKTILAASSCKNKKFYINPEYDFLPQSVKKDIKALCSVMAEKLRGIFEVGFFPNGEFYMDAYPDEDTFDFDEVGAGLEISRLEREHDDFFKALRMCFVYKEITNDQDRES